MIFLFQKKYYFKIEEQNKIYINVFCYENKLTYPVYLSDENINDNMDLWLISNHYVHIKNFDRFMFNKTKNKNKIHFCKSCLQCFSSKHILIEHKEDCLVINDFTLDKYQFVLKFMLILNVFLKILKMILLIMMFHIQKNIKIIFLVVLLITLCMLIINSVKKLFCIEERMLLIKLLNQFLMSTILVENINEKIFL